MIIFLLILAHVRAEENVYKKIFEIGNQWDEGIGLTKTCKGLLASKKAFKFEPQ